MKGELVSIVTGDGYELQGLLCTSSKPQTDDKTSFNKAILHIHGLAGNFYENRFVSVVADELNAHGYTFLTVNNRGSGVLSELRKCTADGLELVEVGGAREVFEDCLYDIQAWINFLDSQGYSKIVLQGHSFGCYKVVFYQSCRSDPRVKALALISPPDVFGYQYAKYGGRF